MQLKGTESRTEVSFLNGMIISDCKSGIQDPKLSRVGVISLLGNLTCTHQKTNITASNE